jgi:hypothetical protein
MSVAIILMGVKSTHGKIIRTKAPSRHEILDAMKPFMQENFAIVFPNIKPNPGLITNYCVKSGCSAVE